MSKRLWPAVATAVALTVSFAAAKDYVQLLKDKDAATRALAAAELRARAIDKGLAGDEVEALAAATSDAEADVRRLATEALACNAAIAVGEAYAPAFVDRGDDFVGFLLWYAVYTAYSEIAAHGGDAPQTTAAMETARKEAKAAFGRIADAERKNLAAFYYRELP